MIFLGNGLVWDAERKTILCEFKNGTYETEDDRTIKILQDNGYKTENGVEIVISDAVEVEISNSDLSMDELFDLCKERHYKGCYTIKDKEKLLAFIAKKEAENA